MSGSSLMFVLMVLVEGCAGPIGPAGSCSVRNFSVRVPFASAEQCESARRQMAVPGGAQRFISGTCLVQTADAGP